MHHGPRGSPRSKTKARRPLRFSGVERLNCQVTSLVCKLHTRLFEVLEQYNTICKTHEKCEGWLVSYRDTANSAATPPRTGCCHQFAHTAAPAKMLIWLSHWEQFWFLENREKDRAPHNKETQSQNDASTRVLFHRDSMFPTASKCVLRWNKTKRVSLFFAENEHAKMLIVSLPHSTNQFHTTQSKTPLAVTIAEEPTQEKATGRIPATTVSKRDECYETGFPCNHIVFGMLSNCIASLPRNTKKITLLRVIPSMAKTILRIRERHA